MRLNRYLAAAGLGSRRSVEAIILEGRVRINGRPVEDLSTLVQPGDVVKVGNKVVRLQETIHAVLFKPRGFVCTASDEHDRRTIFDLIPSDWPRVFHVGRLDKDSEGLLVVTNDGELALALTHPRFKIEKEYEVTLDRAFDPAHMEKLLRGFHIEGGRAKMERIEIISPIKIRVILQQGIKRQIRLMLYDCGYEVENLRRTRIGTVGIEKLRAGMWRMLSPKDVADLKSGRSPKRRTERPPALQPAPEQRLRASRSPAPPKTALPRERRRVSPRPPRPSSPEMERPRPRQIRKPRS